MKNIAGVSFDGRFFIAAFYAVDKKVQRKFSVNRYGKIGALIKAINCRRDNEIEVRGTSSIPKKLTTPASEHNSLVKYYEEKTAARLQKTKKERQKKQQAEYAQWLKDKDKGGKFIYRKHSSKTGYYWELKIAHQGKTVYNHAFRDSQFGSKNKSLKAAKKEREKALKKHNIPLGEGHVYVSGDSRNSNSGVTGITLAKNACIAHIYSEPYKGISCKFSFSKHEDDIAFQKALEWRRDREIEIFGQTELSDDYIQKKLNEFRKTYKISRHQKILAQRHDKESQRQEKRQRKLEKFKRDRDFYNEIAGKYIYRIDYFNSGHGWILRIPYKDTSLIDKFFPDSAYGSKIQALEEAQKLRSKILKEKNIPYAENRNYSYTKRKVNKSGVTGVSRNNAKNSYNAWIYEEPRKVKRRTFSINKYGDEFTAYSTAVEWRRDKEIEVYGGTILTDEHLEAIYANFDELLANMKAK